MSPLKGCKKYVCASNPALFCVWCCIPCAHALTVLQGPCLVCLHACVVFASTFVHAAVVLLVGDPL
jgi:hypothetical protein